MTQDGLIIFDTTLRDGEQSPGASMTLEEKVRIARQLDRLRVDVIEAGFPIASPGDFASVQAVAQSVRSSTVCALARTQKADVARAGEALRGCSKARIHTFISTSPLHMERKLRMTPDQVVVAAVEAVRLAKNYTDDVEFSAEDAARSEPDFLCRIFSEVIAVGATTINVPDTVGYSVPERYAALLQEVMRRTEGGHKVVWSVHCHNDLGLAVANSLAAVQIGVRQVECTINGLGERAGNAALEEIVMAVRTRPDIFRCHTHIDTTQIVPTSKLVATITGFPVQPNKAIVGANAFAHASGIHQDGVLKHRETYEIMKAEDVGWQANRLILSKLSGRNAFRTRLEELGIFVGSEERLNQAFARFKDLADRKREIFDEDLHALMAEEGAVPMQERYHLVWMSVSSEMGEVSRSRVTLSVDGQEVTLAAQGDGPVDATFQAIQRLVGSEAKLQLYSVNAITGGTDAQGEVTVRLEQDGQVVNGQGADTDIVAASAKAYLNALNRMANVQVRLNPQGAAV